MPNTKPKQKPFNEKAYASRLPAPKPTGKPSNKEKNPVQQFISNLKIGYINGKNPIARAMTGHGFRPSKNAALNIGALMRIPYDPERRIRPKDPQQALRSMNSGIGGVERIHNTYLKPLVKLAD